MRSYYQQLSILFKRLAIVYLLYFLCRILFFAANRIYFENVGVLALLQDCVAGLRFDTFSIVVSNCLFIILSLLPLRVFWNPGYQRLLLWLYAVMNAIFIAVNCIDVPYFPFIKKRSTSDIFEQVKGQTDIGKLLPQFLADFWWVILLFILFIYLLVRLYKSVRWDLNAGESSSGSGKKLLQWFLFVFFAALSVLGVRGGFQRVPIDLVNAGSMTRPEEVPIVLNTPFSLIKSLTQTALQEYEFFDEEELKTIYDPIHQFEGRSFKKDNVVVLILESFSKEYTKLGKTISVTPFLDSLMDHSLVFTNAFSNGTKSIEGIPAILSGLPSLMPNPLINSMYANNDQTSLPRLLNKEGYECAFFHGGINGTMNFDDWAALAGYQHYYGKNEYNNDKDFDGYWGIWDEPFLQWSIRKMDALKQPFHSAIFTLSSHHPYFIPEKYKGRFKKNGLENGESLGYGDHSLRLFFESAKKTTWYNNTLFVLVADHTGISNSPFYNQVAGLSSIPILFYKPDNSLTAEHAKAFSQMDILPSILDYLGYNKKFFSFGGSYREKQQGNDYLFANGTYYLLSDSMVYCFQPPELREVFNYRRDSTLHAGIKGLFPLLDSTALRGFKAFIQTYHSAIIGNNARVKN